MTKLLCLSAVTASPGRALNRAFSTIRRTAFPWRYGFLTLLVLPGIGVAQAQVNVYTRSYDANRTGANTAETTLTPANVNATNFGKLYTVPIDGQVYAQPLFVSNVNIDGSTHDIVLVASMLNSVYAIDAPTGNILWQQNFGTPIKAQEVESDQNISWNTGIGILGTPVIDPETNYMYFVSGNEAQVNGAPVYTFRLNAIDITTGAPVHGSPMTINATYSTADLASPLVFNAMRANQRPGLALANGNVYIAFASHEDQQPYHGWVLAYNTSTLQQTAVYSDTTVGIEGGIWNAGGAPTIDTYGNVLISTGNGSFGPTTNNLVQTGNSFIKLSPTLQLLDYFTPYNSASLNSGDQDLGASGLLLIPGTNYVVGGGKQGVLYLTDITNMGKFNSSMDQVRQEFQGIFGKGTSHLHGGPTYLKTDANGPTIFVWGENDMLRAYPFNAETGLLNATPLATSTMTAPVTNNDGAMPGGFTSLTANGTANGIVWASTPYNDDAVHHVVQGVLYAFDAETLKLLWSDKTQDARDEVGVFAKYCPPIVANGRMFVPTFGASISTATGNGQLIAYGLLPQLVVTAANASMIAGGAVPTLTGSVTGLKSGDALGSTIDVTYSTTATSSSPAGTYPITATVSGSSVNNYRISLNAGTLTVTANTPPPPVTGGSGPISYPGGFAGSKLQLNGSATLNGSRLRLTDGKLNEAATAFFPTAVNVQSFTNDFTFQLTNPAADGITMLIQADGPTALGASGGGLGLAPGIKKSVAVKFDLYSNSGESTDSTGLYLNGQLPTIPSLDLSGTGVTLKSGAIFAVHSVYDGALLNVTITNTATGVASTQSYAVDIPGTLGATSAYLGFSAGTGSLVSTQEILTWSYTPSPDFTSGFSAAQLSLNGGAALNGNKLRILDGSAWEAHSAFFTTPVNVKQFSSAFTFQLTNAAADGIAFVLQNTGTTAVGGSGGSLGVGPAQGSTSGGIAKSVAIKFDLFNNSGEGIDSTGLYLNGAAPTTPSTDLTPTGVNLHSTDPIAAVLNYDGTTLTVTLTDTVTKASATQAYKVDIAGTLGATTGYVGFTGGTGQQVATADIQSWSYLAGTSTKPQLVYPTEALTSSSSGPTFRSFAWSGYPDGVGTVLDSTKVGDKVSFTVDVPESGTYDIKVNSKRYNNRAVFQLTVDGIDTGAATDEYLGNTADGSFGTFDLGSLALNAGAHTFTFTVVNKNAQASDWKLSFGQLILTAQ
ncbi:MBG domain-containing protein [Acidipila sp. EB88]|uniref:MBG domain-containing protein n=1 Tax=Acidipila sp. EB88 TaxID=2305226 RepID=UPI001315422D|nr:MBG domain-containing protein [Acidipila sp. EB88]